MFKIDFFVDDKYLAEVLRTLSGRTRNLSVVPVSNAIPHANGEIKSKAGRTVDLFVAELKKHEAVTPKIAKECAQKIGLSPVSYLHLLEGAMKQGAIKRHGKGSNTKYEWA